MAHGLGSLQISPLEISQAYEVLSNHAVRQLLSSMQILSLLGCFWQPGSSGIRVVDAQDFCSAAGSAKLTEPVSFLACTRSRPICTTILGKLCGLLVHEGRSA
jgi:hypothetical protein